MVSTLTAIALLIGTCTAQPPEFEAIPKVDVHAHYFDDMPPFVKMLERINMRVVTICVFKDRPHMIKPLHERAVEFSEKYPNTMLFASTFDLSDVGKPEFGPHVTDWLAHYFERGAVMTKIWKEVGMQTRLPDGRYLMPDAVELEPVYDYLESRGKPLIAHFADPVAAWQPLNERNVHYRYFSNNPEWHMYAKPGAPTHQQITEAFDAMLAKHPELVVIGAHLGSLEHDLPALATRFERFPNFHVDVGARTPDLKHYPAETVREFFIAHQDRLLYGLDQGTYHEEPLSPDEAQAYADRLESWYRQEFAYYAVELDLPRDVLEKFYYRNAARLIPRLQGPAR